jgi:hypothetical protein
MARQFFVGGNFKLNPASRSAKQALIKVLNEADLDSSIGTQQAVSLTYGKLNNA